MYKERRTHMIPPEDWINHQTAEWMWDSHLWVKSEPHGLACEWCGWVPPTECPISMARICKSNPEVIGVMARFKDTFEEFLLDFTTKVRSKFK